MSAQVRPFRVLLSAYVDLNVIDGSAFFVAGVATLLTSAPGMSVDVVAAAPVRRPVVVQEMLLNDRVTLIDPFRDQVLATRLPELVGKAWMDEVTLATVLAAYLDREQYDVVILRSTEAAHALSRLRPDLGSRLCVYVTGVVADDAEVAPTVLQRLQSLVDGGATLLCQTSEMQAHVRVLLRSGGDAGTVAVLSPAVPSAPGSTTPTGRGPLVLAYTGKFAPAWNTVEMLAGLKEASAAGADLRLVVAGDHFKRPAEWPTFAAEVRYLLGSHSSISWAGAVTRADARALVAGADLGIGWRHGSLDSSLELSTKLLEHGVLGRPCIINPTPMHQRLFGADYPLFASSMTDFVDLLTRLDQDRDLVRRAADTAMKVAADYTYERVFRSVFPTLLSASGALPGKNDQVGLDILELCGRDDRVLTTGGRSTAWLTDQRDAAQILRTVGTGTMQDVRRWGPFISWRTLAHGEGDGAEATLDLLAEILVDEREGASTILPEGELTVVHDLSGRVQLGVAAPPAPAAGGMGATGGDAARLSAQLREKERQVSDLTTRLEALAGTPLGRLQRAYWRLLRRLRRRH